MTRANKYGMALVAMLTTLAVAFSLLCAPGWAKEGNDIPPCRATAFQPNVTGTGYGYNDTDAGDIPVPAEDEESQQNAADYTVTMKQHLVVSYATWCEMIRSPKYSVDKLRDDETFPAKYLSVSTDDKPVADADLTVEYRGKDAVRTSANNVVLCVDTSQYGENADAPKADLYVFRGPHDRRVYKKLGTVPLRVQKQWYAWGMHANWWDTQYLPETERKVIETTLTPAEAKMLRGEDGSIDLILACRRFGFELFNMGLTNTSFYAGRWPFAIATSLIEAQVNDDREAALLSGTPTTPGDPYVITFTSPGAPEGFIHGSPVPLTVKVSVVDNGQRTGGYGEQRESGMQPSSQPKDYELKARTLHMLGVDWVKILLLNNSKGYPDEGLKLKAADYFRVGVNDADADINIIPKHADADLDVEALIADVELVICPGFWYTAGEKELRVDVQGLPVSRVKVIVQQEHRYELTANGTTANGGVVELTPERAKALVPDGDLAAPDLKALLDTVGLALIDWDISAVDQLGTVVAAPNDAGTAYVYTATLPTGDYLYVNVKNDVLTGTLGENGEPATYSPGIRIGLFFKDGGADDMYQYDVTIANKEPEPEPEPEPKPEPSPGPTPGPGAERCVVTFDANGGTPASYPPQTVECGSAGKVTRPTPDPTRKGYEFVGWFVKDAVVARAAQTLRMFDFAKDTVSSDMTLAAAWTKQEEPDEPDSPGANGDVQVPDDPDTGGADDGNIDGGAAGKPQEPSAPDGGQDSLPGGNGGSSARPGGNAAPGLATTGAAVAGFAGLAALLVVVGVTLAAARRRRN